jgi:hypothetical protein
MDEMGWTDTVHGGTNAYTILVGKPQHLGKCRPRWKDDIKIYLRGTGCEDMN